jgi:hypothetical protein
MLGRTLKVILGTLHSPHREAGHQTGCQQSGKVQYPRRVRDYSMVRKGDSLGETIFFGGSDDSALVAMAVSSWVCYNSTVLDEVQSCKRFAGPPPEKRREEGNASNEIGCQ